MKKLVLIAIVVLVPFVGLVVWGLSGDDAPRPPPLALEPMAESSSPPPPVIDTHKEPPAPLPTPLNAMARLDPANRPEAPATPVPVAPREQREAAESRGGADELHQAAVTQLRPNIERCFSEHRAEVKGKLLVRMMFTVSPDGQIQRPRLKVSDPSPYLQACLDDAIANTQIDVSRGVPVGNVRGRFDFDPDAKKK
jgi:hypothetical protein